MGGRAGGWVGGWVGGTLIVAAYRCLGGHVGGNEVELLRQISTGSYVGLATVVWVLCLRGRGSWCPVTVSAPSLTNPESTIPDPIPIIIEKSKKQSPTIATRH